MKAIINAFVVLRDRILKQHAVVFDSKIRSILPQQDLPRNCTVVDANGKYLIPGLIDLHIHGAAGADTMDTDEAGLTIISEYLVGDGVTGFLPTTVSSDTADLQKALKTIRVAQTKTNKGALILGAHIEGPYLNPEKKGAHDSGFLISPDRSFVENYLDVISILTMAPETDPSFIKWAVDRGIVVSLGHSMATYTQAVCAFSNGASMVTHLFNGMSGIHHQEPGLAGAGLLSDEISVELIADTVHVRKELFPLIYKAKGPDNIILITDCMRAGGMPPGRYKLGRMDVITDEKSARLKSDGSLAGSVLHLNKAVRNFEVNAGISRSSAVLMASYNPARILGLEDKYGSIEKGKHANMALVDEEMNVYCTIIDGVCVYKK